jgi:hypothetical protein
VNPSELIAERRLTFITPGGDEIASAIQFSRPYLSDEFGICCDMEIPGIEKRRLSAGTDGVQAIQIAMSLAATVVGMLIADGWQVLWPDTREQTTSAEILGCLHDGA